MFSKSVSSFFFLFDHFAFLLWRLICFLLFQVDIPHRHTQTHTQKCAFPFLMRCVIVLDTSPFRVNKANDANLFYFILFFFVHGENKFFHLRRLFCFWNRQNFLIIIANLLFRRGTCFFFPPLVLLLSLLKKQKQKQKWLRK